ncbi:MAG TPA: hypothetical protein VN457_00785, partial [Chlamydiales bacterium]|nr:hypothetical protein [Chlamydiales bacterium]
MSGPGTGPVSVLKMPMQPSFTPAPYKAPDPTATPTGVMSGPGSGSAKPVSVMSGSASSSGPSVQVQAKPQPAPPPPKPVKSDAQIKAETLARAVSNIIAALNPPIKTHIDGLAA